MNTAARFVSAYGAGRSTDAGSRKAAHLIEVGTMCAIRSGHGDDLAPPDSWGELDFRQRTHFMSNRMQYEFRYRLKPGGIAPLLIIGGVGVGVCLYFAVVPPLDTIRINGTEISTGNFQLLMVLLAAIAALFLALMAKETFWGETQCGRIALTDDAVILPGPDWWGNAWTGNEDLTLRYCDIVSVAAVPFVAHELKLHIVHTGGQIGLPRNMFENRHEFERLSQLLQARIDRDIRPIGQI